LNAFIRTIRLAVSNAEGVVSSPEIKATMKRVVPTFRDPEEINKNAENCEEMKLAEMA
jgi:hypothetical protein